MHDEREERDDVVIINGLEISGYVDKTKRCSICQNHTIYDNTFDAYFCASCNDWKEEKCSDSHCYYCLQRPERPLLSK